MQVPSLTAAGVASVYFTDHLSCETEDWLREEHSNSSTYMLHFPIVFAEEFSLIAHIHPKDKTTLAEKQMVEKSSHSRIGVCASSFPLLSSGGGWGGLR